MSDGRRVIVVGISGASGAALGIRLIEVLHEMRDRVETHLVVTEGARTVLLHEAGVRPDSLAPLVHRLHEPGDMAAPIASGTFRTDGMVVIPCSMKTLSGLACGYAENLLLRAGDVHLKERRRLVLVPREAPFGTVHLENMLRLSRAGAIVLPPVLSLYARPSTIGEAIDQVAGKALDLLGVESDVLRRWA